MSREHVNQSSDGDVDDALIARFLAGDTRAFDSLFERHQDYVYRVAYSVIGRAEEARDVTQEVFVQVYRSLGSFRRGSRFATWLYRIAVNRAVDYARSTRGRQWGSLDDAARVMADPSADPADAAAQRHEQACIQQALDDLPVHHRTILGLRYFQDLSVEEIAQTLGCTVTAAKVRLFRARQHFKDAYIARFERGSDAEK